MVIGNGLAQNVAAVDSVLLLDDEDGSRLPVFLSILRHPRVITRIFQAGLLQDCFPLLARQCLHQLLRCTLVSALATSPRPFSSRSVGTLLLPFLIDRVHALACSWFCSFSINSRIFLFFGVAGPNSKRMGPVTLHIALLLGAALLRQS